MGDVPFDKGRLGCDVLGRMVFGYVFGVLDVGVVDLLEALLFSGWLLSASFDHNAAFWSR